MRRSFHSVFKCFHILSQGCLWDSRKTFPAAHRLRWCASVSQTPDLIMTACLPVIHANLLWPSKKSCLRLSLWVNSVVEIVRPLLSGNKPRGNLGQWGPCRVPNHSYEGDVHEEVCRSPGNSQLEEDVSQLWGGQAPERELLVSCVLSSLTAPWEPGSVTATELTFLPGLSTLLTPAISN